MSRLIFKLRHVPDDEAEDVRQLLHDHDIDFYETSAGNWGISMPGIWLRNDDDYGLASSLLAEYQSQRQRESRGQYEADKAAGRAETQLDRLRQEPVKVILYFCLCAALIYVLVTAFYRL